METGSKETGLNYLSSLKEASRRAFYWTSQDPEGRGLRTLQDFEKTLVEDLKQIPNEEQENYIAKFKSNVSAYLSAESRCASSFVTGGANFNVRKAENANKYASKCYDNIKVFREKAFKAIERKIEASKTPEQKQNETLNLIIKKVKETFLFLSIPDNIRCYNKALFVANLYKKVEKYAYKGDVELMELVVEEIKKLNEEYKVVTNRHKFFNLVELAKEHQTKHEDIIENVEVEGVQMVSNTDLDRLQLFFNGKPKPEVITLLKKNAFHWSPSNKAWQRQLTTNALYAANNILSSIAKQ